MISIIYVTLKCGTNELVYKIATDSDIDNRFAVVKGGVREGEVYTRSLELLATNI